MNLELFPYWHALRAAFFAVLILFFVAGVAVTALVRGFVYARRARRLAKIVLIRARRDLLEAHHA